MGDGHQAILVFDGDCTSTDLHPRLGCRILILKGWPFPIFSNLCPCNNARWQLHFELPTVPSLWWIALKVVLCRQRRCYDKPFKKGWSHVCLQTALDFRNDLWVYVITQFMIYGYSFYHLDITRVVGWWGLSAEASEQQVQYFHKVGKLFPHSATQTRILRTPPWMFFSPTKLTTAACWLFGSQVNKVDRCILEMRMDAETRLHSGYKEMHCRFRMIRNIKRASNLFCLTAYPD